LLFSLDSLSQHTPSSTLFPYTTLFRSEFPQAEAAIKIRGKYLRALEDEQFELLPAETYVKGFLRTYAEYLGLDGQLYVDEFNSRSEEHTSELQSRVDLVCRLLLEKKKQ